MQPWLQRLETGVARRPNEMLSPSSHKFKQALIITRGKTDFAIAYSHSHDLAFEKSNMFTVVNIDFYIIDFSNRIFSICS